MKKIAGLISFIVCCSGIILFLFMGVKLTYLDIKHQEEIKRTMNDELLYNKDHKYFNYTDAEIYEEINHAQHEINEIRERIPLLLLICFIGTSIFVLGSYYIVATKFGSTTPTLLKNLEKENNFIRKNIEKNELIAKLKNLEG